jgi:translation initiation factor 5A
MTDFDEEFEKTDAGASDAIPATAGDIKKNGYMVFNGDRPCKVMDYSTAKTGKHGHAKASITGIDIFTGKKYEDSVPTSHGVLVPTIIRTAWQVLSLDGDYVTLFDPNTGNTKSDLSLPNETEDDIKNAKIIVDGVEEGKTMNVTVLSSMGIEKIVDPKEDNS